MNEKQILQKILSSLNNRRFILFIFLAFLTGCLFTGFILNRYRFTSSGELDKRYHSQHGRAAEIITGLENELGHERELNRRLREENTRARELTVELTGTAERNVRNLQDAVAIIAEIRTKIKVLENFYNNSGSGGSAY